MSKTIRNENGWLVNGLSGGALGSAGSLGVFQIFVMCLPFPHAPLYTSSWLALVPFIPLVGFTPAIMPWHGHDLLSL